jgi:MFS family permease
VQICVACFGFSTLIFGNWIERWGPFYALRRTLFLTPAGWAFACLGSWPSVGKLGIVYAGWGICHGVGAGIAYIALCSCAGKWFPEFKGFATGLAVMGFGVGYFIWTTIGKALMSTSGSYHMKPYQVQGIYAAVYFCALLIVLPLLRNPPPGWKPDLSKIENMTGLKGRIVRLLTEKTSALVVSDKDYTYLQAVTTQEFILCLFIVFGQFITGVTFLSSASNMTQYIFGKDADEGAFITSMLNLCNIVGRFGFGFISDKIGRKNFYLMATAAQSFAIGLMAVWIRQGHYGAWILSFLLIGALYGGGFGVLPAFMSDLFGPKISAATHGTTISVWAIATIVGVPIFTSFTGRYYTMNGASKLPMPVAYIYNSYWLCGLPAMAFVCLLFLCVRNEDRAIRRWKRDVRLRFFKYVIRFDRSGVKVLDPTAQAEEWSAYQEYMAAENAKKDEIAAAEAKNATALSLENGSAESEATATVVPIEPTAVTLTEVAPEIAKA